MRRWWVAALLVVTATVASAQAGGRELRGIVVDTAGHPIPGASLSVLGTSRRASSDDQGRFTLGVVTAKNSIVVRRPGFLPDTLRMTAPDTTEVRIVLRTLVTELNEIVVRDSARRPARFDDFERRRQRRTGGQFITRDEIEKLNPLNTTDVLRRMQGFKIRDSMGVSVAVSTRGPKPSLNSGRVKPCVLLVGLDGFVTDRLNLNSIPPADIHGIEVYTGPNMPPEFSGARPDNYCGLIMIWTR